MNVLFEAYVAALMRKAIRPLNLSVESQGGRLFCLVEESGHRRFQTKPDLIIRRRPEDGGKVLAIIDTKWKRLSPMVEDRKNGVSQSDVYQMMAYGQLYGCRELVLLYPHHTGLGEDGLELPYRVSSSEDRLHVKCRCEIARGFHTGPARKHVDALGGLEPLNQSLSARRSVRPSALPRPPGKPEGRIRQTDICMLPATDI